MRIEIGAPGEDDLEVAVQHNFRTGGRQFGVDLPAQVVRYGRQHFVRLLPLASVVVAGARGSSARAALCSFAEADAGATSEAFAAFDRLGARRVPSRVELSVRSADMTVGDVIDAAAAGSLALASTAAGEMRVRAHVSGRKRPVETNWFPAQIAADALPDPEPGADGIWQVFSCHSHWFVEQLGKPNRRHFTVCHGPCDPGTGPCACGTPPARRCWGWSFCWC